MKIRGLFAIALLALTVAGCEKTNPRVLTRTNDDASLTGKLPWNPMKGRVITSWVDKPSATMATLYGNNDAVQYARTHTDGQYPVGAVLALVTWHQQEDPRWFGGNIPSRAASVEYVIVATSPDRKYLYQKYEGSPLQQVTDEGAAAPNARSLELMSERAAFMP
jgi:hypothetical protein